MSKMQAPPLNLIRTENHELHLRVSCTNTRVSFHLDKYINVISRYKYLTLQILQSSHQSPSRLALLPIVFRLQITGVYYSRSSDVYTPQMEKGAVRVQ